MNVTVSRMLCTRLFLAGRFSRYCLESHCTTYMLAVYKVQRFKMSLENHFLDFQINYYPEDAEIYMEEWGESFYQDLCDMRCGQGKRVIIMLDKYY
ncbi:hypothetical protein TNIN_225201 [Trichonephila inaurata madagascariensis]|uniref:Uncharacterized protein n=1 Tax=Trichonephila inaurata madagascariensis TaxID=2747483 RepID=A0A8X7C3C6_9ARAC|nr:hypothetical protein TNIN_225201 [Trichonephila inaurata madagascariensis]